MTFSNVGTGAPVHHICFTHFQEALYIQVCRGSGIQERTVTVSNVLEILPCVHHTHILTFIPMGNFLQPSGLLARFWELKKPTTVKDNMQNSTHTPNQRAWICEAATTPSVPLYHQKSIII